MTDFHDYQKDALYFLPLGGSGEYGRNLNLYQYNGSWLMVDLGASFIDPDLPGIELVVPDPAYIERQRHRLAGLIVTHAHEDHIGAIPYLWPRLRCPIYVTPFAANFLEAKLNDIPLDERPEIHVIDVNTSFAVGPFTCRMVPITHSIPESTMVEIITPQGRLVHTGDWKLDHSPMVGDSFNSNLYKEMGDAGVLAVITDSTNASVPGHSGSEEDVAAGLAKVMARLSQRIIVTCFSSNIGRIHSIAKAAEANGRQVALLGWSLWRFEKIAREIGYFDDLPPFLDPKDIELVPRDKMVIICTGSQGEVQAALSRLAAGDHPKAEIDPGDHVIFSARRIPGCELAIGRVQDMLLSNGFEVITPYTVSECIYASGHPCQDELTQMYQWLRPQILLPVHGERRQQEDNAKLARACQVPEVLIPQNGTVVRLAPGPVEIVGNVTTGRLAMDGKALVSTQSNTIRERKKLMYQGAALATLVVDDRQRLIAPPKLTLRGLSEGESALDDVAEITAALELAFDKLPLSVRKKDDELVEAMALAIRRAAFQIHHKKPVTDVHIVRV